MRSGGRFGGEVPGRVGPHGRSARSRPHLHPKPRGRRVGGRNFPARGLSRTRLAVRPFLFTERKGKWKRRGGGWRLLRRPGAGSVAGSQGPAAHGCPSGRSPAFRPPPPALGDASTPGSRRQATHCLLSPVSGRVRGTLGNRDLGALGVFRGRPL